MIGRILYRENAHGVLNYVFGKQGMTVLGYQNTCSENLSQKFFGDILHFRGQRNASRNRYAHITLNLPYDDRLEDSAFYEVAKDYMGQMGYGEQPYVVVRHNDTKHEHVHIVSTNVNAIGTLINTSHPYRRNVAVQRYLEKKYGLSPSPPTKQRQQRELPVYRSPELQFGMDDGQGARFYLQDTLNSILQRYQVRSFGELAKLAKPYQIVLKMTKTSEGRIGVAYGLDNQKGYRTRFINGSAVHPRLSGPKLQNIFNKVSKSKLIPMHRKRLGKQIETTYKLFKNIHPEELTEVLKAYENIDTKLDSEVEVPKGFTVYDKSGYVFSDSELGHRIKMENNLDIFGHQSERTEIDTDSEQFTLEIRKLIKEAFYGSYLQSPKQGGLISENIVTKNFGNMLPRLKASKSYLFLDRYIPENRKAVLAEALRYEFSTVRDRLCRSETRKEIETLNNKFGLIGKVLQNAVFKVGQEKGSVHHLFRSLGVKYHNDRLSFSGSNKHTMPVRLGDLPLPKEMDEHISSGFVRQNHMVLESLVTKENGKGSKLGASAIFLPMVFPKLYETMSPAYKERFEKAALAAYVKHAERLHAPFEKSPKDYIAFFNAKGFHFVRGKDGFEVKSIYMGDRTSCTLSKRTSLYLNSIPNLSETLEEQQTVINGLVKDDKDNLKNLWAAHLIELGRYDRVAFMITVEKVYPNLNAEMIHHHMDNGLRKVIVEIQNRKTSYQQNRLLRKGVYAISSLLGYRKREQEEVYNGFKDELTDYSKYKDRGLLL